MNSIKAQNSILDMLKDGVADLFGTKMQGGAPAMDALEDVFKGGSPEFIQKQYLILEDLSTDSKMKGGNNQIDDNDDESNVYVEVDDFEPIDMDGKESVGKSDDGEPFEDSFVSDHDNETEHTSDDFTMAGGSGIYNVPITPIMKYPFVLKSFKR